MSTDAPSARGGRAPEPAILSPEPGPAHRPRARWHDAVVAATSPETPAAVRIVLHVPGWPGNLPGQHLDVRLTAEDGYQATRAYSIASSGAGERVVLAVDRVDDGEVSPYLVDEAREGDRLEVHGPLGGWFVWTPDAAATAVRLVAGGSGIVPLVAMIGAHAAAGDAARFSLIHSVRTPADVFFRRELEAALAATAPLTVHHVFTRAAPPGEPVGRLTPERLAALAPLEHPEPLTYVCGSTPFVEQVLAWLREDGHETRAVRAERFGGA